ncbi:sensor histidine kinase [Sphingomicrobium flavum]|uniref:sensor histidine kinase n=1 Tax=Sphingomicrobium flavum TaxID=1229164 RepID=UPI0021AD56C3|nr:sensor histidine kinase [Sphingomicrobium flavum]
MIGIAALWIAILLLAGGFALDRILTRTVSNNFNSQLEFILNAMIASAEPGVDGELRLSEQLADQRFLEPYSGIYFQITGEGYEPFPSPSLWDRRLDASIDHEDTELHIRDSNEFEGEPLRILERDIILPDSDVRWRFQVAESRERLDQQITELRRTLFWSLAVLGLGLILMAALQTLYGLWPLRRVRREVVAIRSGRKTRVAEDFPREIMPLTDEINELLAHNEARAEEARRHAGNLAHALKTPLTVITNAATADDENLNDIVCREATVMRRQVDHHLARARAIGRRASAQARANVATSVETIERAVSRLYEGSTIDVAGDRDACVRVERQDLDEILGNLIENAAKYGGGRVFVTIEQSAPMVDILIEDDGKGIPEEQRAQLFTRGARLDTDKPGTGLGLAIVKDVAEIYGGSVSLGESEDLGGLLVMLSLPAVIEEV